MKSSALITVALDIFFNDLKQNDYYINCLL